MCNFVFLLYWKPQLLWPSWYDGPRIIYNKNIEKIFDVRFDAENPKGFTKVLHKINKCYKDLLRIFKNVFTGFPKKDKKQIIKAENKGIKHCFDSRVNFHLHCII